MAVEVTTANSLPVAVMHLHNMQAQQLCREVSSQAKMPVLQKVITYG